MTELLTFLSTWDRTLADIGFSVMVRASAVLAIAFAVHFLLGRRRVLVRSVVWNTSLLGLLVLPFVVIGSPRVSFNLPESKTTMPSAAPVKGSSEIDTALAVVQEPVRSEAPMQVELPKKVAPEAHRAQPDFRPQTQLRFRWVPAIAFAYVLVMFGLVVRLVASLMAVSRLARESYEVTERGWHDALKAWTEQLGVVRSVRLAQSSKVSVPVVVGWRSPIVILPTRIAGMTVQPTIDAILVHELAHVQRGDYGWNLVRLVAQALYWPHPLTWFMSPVIASVREQACDDLCIHWLGGAEGYRNTLLEVATSLVRRPGPSLGMAMGRSTRIGQRLSYIARSSGRSQCLLKRSKRLVVSAVAIGAVGIAGSIQVVRTAVAQAPREAKRDQANPSSGGAENPRANENAAEKPADATKEAAGTKKNGNALPGTGDDPKAPILVLVEKPLVEERSTSYSEICILKPIVTADVFPKTQGVLLASELAEPGDHVKQGQVLGVLEDSNLQAQILAARSKLQRAESEWDGIRLEMDQATLNLEEESDDFAAIEADRRTADTELAALEMKRTALEEEAESAKDDRSKDNADAIARLEELIRRQREKIVSITRDQRSAKLVVAKMKAGVEACKAAEQAARVARNEAKEQLALLPVTDSATAQITTKLVSPIDGTVLNRNLQPEQSTQAIAGRPAFVVARTDSLLAEIGLSESDALLVNVDNPVEFRLTSRPSLRIKGKIHRINSVIEQEKLRVQVEIPNKDGKLRPGMRGVVTLILGPPHRALTIPYPAIKLLPSNDHDNGVGFCFRVVDGRAVGTPIHFGSSSGGRVEVFEGLKEDDQIVTYVVRHGRPQLPLINNSQPMGALWLSENTLVKAVDLPPPHLDDRWDIQSLPRHDQGFGAGGAGMF